MLNKISLLKKRISNFFFTGKSSDKLEVYLLKYLPRNKSINIIDIGAHAGSFVENIEKYYHIKKAILVEPIKELANDLQKKFNKKEYAVFQNAVSDNNGESLSFQINEFAETSSLFEFNKAMKELENVNIQLNRVETVTTRTLDSIVNETALQEIDLIKIDVQGAEHLVLKGANNTLKIAAFLWVEVSFKPLYNGSSTFKDIYEIMDNNGFKLLEISPGHRSPIDELLQADALFVNTNR